MNNINIKNIFDNNYNLTKSIINVEEHNYSSYNFNVSDLTPNSNPYIKLTDEYLINKIKYNEFYEQKKTEELYESKYNECLMKINNAIDINITDIFFQVLNAHFGYKLYNSYKCLLFIQEKLRKKNFDTLIISNNKMFISWKNSKFDTTNTPFNKKMDHFN
jgi:hypothetical protein